MNALHQAGHEASAYFLQQLDFHGVCPDELAPAVRRTPAEPDTLVVAWDARHTELPALRLERNHIAVFALRELSLSAGQRLLVQGPRQERCVLLIETLRLGAGAQLTLAMPTELVVDRCLCDDTPARMVLTGTAGASGREGVQGANGADAAGAGQQGGAGGYGGDGNHGMTGGASASARISIACLDGPVRFEVSAGAGGAGGAGGRGGRGGQGWLDQTSRRMLAGGHGGTGGAGAQGGAGGAGGSMQVWIAALGPRGSYSTLVTPAPGGDGGDGGRGGVPGLGHPDGAPGRAGVRGHDGFAGSPGRIAVTRV